jgi:uncharacterized protein (DUF1499 family)
MSELRDLRQLRKTTRPNQFLLAPEGFLETGEPDMVSPVFHLPASELFAALAAVVRSRSNVSDFRQEQDGLRLAYTARIPLFGFKDDVDAEAVRGPGGSSLAIYSRSRVGYSDLGVNRRRVLALVEDVGNEMLGRR